MSQELVDLLKQEEAEVVVEGKSYSKALKKAKDLIAANPKAYVSQVSTPREQTKSDLYKCMQDPCSRLR